MKILKKLICKIFGHKYQYNFGWAPNRCKCLRCGAKWKTIKNPNYIPGKTSPLDEDLEIWVEDHSITATYKLQKSNKEFANDLAINSMAENIKKAIDEELVKQIIDQLKKENGKSNR